MVGRGLLPLRVRDDVVEVRLLDLLHRLARPEVDVRRRARLAVIVVPGDLGRLSGRRRPAGSPRRGARSRSPSMAKGRRQAAFLANRLAPSPRRSASRSRGSAETTRAPAPRTSSWLAYSRVSAAAISNSSSWRRVLLRHASRLIVVDCPGSEKEGRPLLSSVALSSTSSGTFIGSTATGAIVSQSTAIRFRIACW